MTDSDPFANKNLPFASPAAPTVTLFREQLANFRDDYDRLIRFAAEVCGVEPEQLALIHMDAYRQRTWPDKYQYPWLQPSGDD